MNLKEYLDANEESTMEFAMRSGLTYSQVHHILAGNMPTLKTALIISVVTHRAVEPEDLVSDKIYETIYHKHRKVRKG